MLSKILLKLIKESIIPALLVVTAKFAGIVLTVTILSIPWTISTQSLFPTITFSSMSNFVTVSSWSNFFVLAAVSLGFLWILIKAHFLHDTHITPQLTLQLLDLDLTNLIDTTPNISNQGIIWLSYLWVLIILTGVQAFFGYHYWWMFALSLFVGAILTWSFIADLEREVEWA
ncbi:hypothetical protein B5M47_02275 [candidate division CPR3 bacterium 4484_211]|uniref:Uncharacterized protein n=1 Tax=candidate division CPR3 bacterium 4484_211 TaxID=1968527 RepID=A0A1W9NXY7_UNCC3|nr:MAG: hypothetical protein B5M47_02275 [candidate division CPR3 bacterium 4484_211]